MAEESELVRYVERVTQAYFDSPVPQRPDSVLQGWADYTREQQEQRANERCVANDYCPLVSSSAWGIAVFVVCVKDVHFVRYLHSVEATLSTPKRRLGNWLWLGAAAALMLGFYTQQPHFPVMFLMDGQDALEEMDGDDDGLPMLANEGNHEDVWDE